MRLDVVTIFPDYLAPLRLSLIGRAIEDGLIDLRVHDLRTWTSDRHRTVDGSPYGGGPGMLMRPEPWGAAFDALAAQGAQGAEAADGARPRVIVPTPGGTPFTQPLAHELAREPWLLFACGRYEGIDARVLQDAAGRAQVTQVTEVSLGDYVLNGGEVAVLAIVEAVARLLPGVIGNADSLVDESHAAGLLEAPGFTKPPTWRGHEVPEVLLSGDHGRIARWRRDESLRRTASRRPDLLERLDADALDAHDLLLLADLGWVRDDARLARPAPPVAD